MINIIEIDKNLTPYRARTTIAGYLYEFEFFYNLEYDYFTVTLWQRGVKLIENEKLILGSELFNDIRYIATPQARIIPLDVSGEVDRITFNNLGEKVFIYVIEEGDLVVQ